MDPNNLQNQSYWFVVREDQSNVIFSSSNNFAIQNPQISGGTRYIVERADSRQYIQLNEAPAIVIASEETPENPDKEAIKQKDDEVFWDTHKVKLLLTLCLENKFKSASKEKHLLNEIATVVGATPEECNKKYRNLRRTYTRLLKKKRQGKIIKWIHYDICEEMFKDSKLSLAVLEPWDDTKIGALLELYIGNLHKFNNPVSMQKDVWNEIATQLETTDYNCYHKFKSLKRTYLNWLDKSKGSGKCHVKWPYQQYFERIFNQEPGSMGPWNRNKIRKLVDAYSKIANKFKSPKYQKKELWRDIAASVGESPCNCDRKFRNLKQTYVRLKMQVSSGRGLSKWRYYKDFEEIFDRGTCFTTGDGLQNLFIRQEEDYIKHLLEFYLENKSKFRDPLTKKKLLWKTIAPKLGMTSEECYRKFRNLKQTYIRLAEKKRDMGKDNRWPYFTYFEQIYDDYQDKSTHNLDYDKAALCEVRKVVQEVKDRHERDKFEKFVKVIEDSNQIQRERNRILQALLERETVRK